MGVFGLGRCVLGICCERILVSADSSSFLSSDTEVCDAEDAV